MRISLSKQGHGRRYDVKDRRDIEHSVPAAGRRCQHIGQRDKQ